MTGQTLKSLQQAISDFDQKREWDGFYPNELLLNLCEEIGEIWQRIAWVDDGKKKQLVTDQKVDIEHDIGDLLFLVLKLANQCNADAESGIQRVLVEYEQRFPPKLVRGRTANKTLGVDEKT
jgi:NTP pyrophosphatase (non-canonical NTP hydrolase)